MTELTTHVLDTTSGRPAAGIHVSLQTRGDGDWIELGARTTDADGRIPPLAAAGAQPHRLVFDLRGRGGFYPEVSITFEVGAGEGSLHVPLLLSPYGYTTYRGILTVATASQTLHDRIGELALIDSVHEGGGLIREVYTAEYDRAVEYVSELMRDAGLDVRLDAAGNLYGTWPGAEPDAPRVLTGSHFDTTLNAGRYDGVVGVLGAIEAIRELRDRGYRPRRTIEVIGFAGEEPRFGAGCIGSRAMTATIGRRDLDLMQDRDGISIAEAMVQRGLDPERLREAWIDPATVHAFVELHIEQGAVLESSGNEIGVVTHIAAPHDLRVSLEGSPMHAGATPMRLRRDALVGAAEAALELERLALASASGTTVGTIGVMRISPSAVNVIPGRVEMDIDVRDSDLAARESVIDALGAKLTELSARRNLALSIETLSLDEPAACSSLVTGAVADACAELEVKATEMISGAYHDAMVLGAQVPIGMIFVPSAGGLSHHPDEYTAPEEIDRGVAVLAGTLSRLAA